MGEGEKSRSVGKLLNIHFSAWIVKQRELNNLKVSEFPFWGHG